MTNFSRQMKVVKKTVVFSQIFLSNESGQKTVVFPRIFLISRQTKVVKNLMGYMDTFVY